LKRYLLFAFLFFASSSEGQSNIHSKSELVYKTRKGHSILVTQGEIYYNRHLIYKYEEDGIIYDSEYNKFIENNGSVLLFLTVDNSPNKNLLEGFKISRGRAKLLSEAVVSKIADLDNDGFLEYGGADVTEVYPNKDSMYYIPTKYFEIRNGSVYFDPVLTRHKDIELNGIYLKNPLNKAGNCCKVIRKPGKRK